jgi:hypothetical protein
VRVVAGSGDDGWLVAGEEDETREDASKTTVRPNTTIFLALDIGSLLGKKTWRAPDPRNFAKMGDPLP